jgi:hypothetical protein
MFFIGRNLDSESHAVAHDKMQFPASVESTERSSEIAIVCSVAPTCCTPLLTQVVSTGSAEFHRRANFRCAAKGRIFPLTDFFGYGPQRGSANSADASLAGKAQAASFPGVRRRSLRGLNK